MKSRITRQHLSERKDSIEACTTKGSFCFSRPWSFFFCATDEEWNHFNNPFGSAVTTQKINSPRKRGLLAQPGVRSRKRSISVPEWKLSIWLIRTDFDGQSTMRHVAGWPILPNQITQIHLIWWIRYKTACTKIATETLRESITANPTSIVGVSPSNMYGITTYAKKLRKFNKQKLNLSK